MRRKNERRKEGSRWRLRREFWGMFLKGWRGWIRSSNKRWREGKKERRREGKKEREREREKERKKERKGIWYFWKGKCASHDYDVIVHFGCWFQWGSVVFDWLRRGKKTSIAPRTLSLRGHRNGYRLGKRYAVVSFIYDWMTTNVNCTGSVPLYTFWKI